MNKTAKAATAEDAAAIFIFVVVSSSPSSSIKIVKMGPKIPKGKNKQIKEVPSTDPAEIVTELDKEFFLFQLSDIEKKIERINIREEELKAGILELNDKIEEFKKENDLIIAEHEQILAMKEEEKMQKREEMMDLEAEVKNRIEKHKKHIEDLKEKFEKMVAVLTERIKEQEEEIRTQEDFKQNKDKYLTELEDMEKQMVEAELQHQRNLFDIEKKFEVAKKRVKKDLQFRLIHLSIEFQETTKKKIGKPCHRATQENKAIQNALLQLEADIIEYQDKCVASKDNMIIFKSQKDNKMLEKDKMIARTLIQVSVIKTLKEDRVKLLKKLKTYEMIEIENKKLVKKFHDLTTELENKKNQIEQVEEKIKQKTDDTNEMSEAVAYLKVSYRRLRVLISNAKKVAEEAMAVRLIPAGGMEEERFLPSDVKMLHFKRRRDLVFAKKGKILRYLLEFLSKGQMTEEDKKYLSIAPEDLDYEIDIDFTKIFGRPEDEEAEELKESVEEDIEKGPLFFTSLTSMSRSITAAVKLKQPERAIEEYGEEEEEEEDMGEDKEEDEKVLSMELDYAGEDFEVEEEEEEDGEEVEEEKI